MSGPASTYASVCRAVDAIVAQVAENDPTVVLYMVARYALLRVSSLRGPQRAAELGYKITDEIATTEAAQ